MYTDFRLAAHLFNPDKLTLARELRGFSKGELAEHISKSVSSISQFEAGKIKPEASTIKEISLALRLPVSFFAIASKSGIIPLENCHFRSLKSAKQSDRREVLAYGSLLSEVIGHLSEHAHLPKDEISPLAEGVKTNEQIEVLANKVRTKWGLGLGPIDKLMLLVESKGAVISICPTKYDGIDAFSTRHKNLDLIFLNHHSCGSRTRFDLAHELGHLLMHQDALPGDREWERQANRFASALLMPRESFSAECPRRMDLELLGSMKKRWRVSIAAMVRRAFDLNIITEATYRRTCIRINQEDIRKKEPNEFESERPTILRKLMKIYLQHSSIDALAESIGITRRHITDILHFNGADSSFIDECIRLNRNSASVTALSIDRKSDNAP